MYPPRIKMTVSMRNPTSTLTLPIKFVGCSSDSQLDMELTFPFGNLIHVLVHYIIVFDYKQRVAHLNHSPPCCTQLRRIYMHAYHIKETDKMCELGEDLACIKNVQDLTGSS